MRGVFAYPWKRRNLSLQLSGMSASRLGRVITADDGAKASGEARLTSNKLVSPAILELVDLSTRSHALGPCSIRNTLSANSSNA